MEPFWEGLRHLTVNALSGIKPPGNPITPERYRQLIARLNTNTLTHAEAQELNVALLELQQQAQANNDLAKLLAIGLGLLFLAAILKNE